jgi:hypothetical protein
MSITQTSPQDHGSLMTEQTGKHILDFQHGKV